MTQKLKPYPEYKDAGLPWLGKIPAHWIQKSIQAITRIKSIKGRTDLPLLSVYRDYGVIRRDSRNDNYNPEGSDLSTYKVVKPGNLVLNKMKTWQGSLGVSKYIGIVSPAYIVCEVIGNIYPMYLHYLLRSKPYVWFYNQISFGVRSNQWDMRYNDFKRIQISLPPIQEQCQIATYLKEREKTINHFIHNKQRLFELINEQKQAIINNAVTRGINPNIRLKPSGMTYLGDIPEHWDVRKLKRVVLFNPSKAEIFLGHTSNDHVVFLPMERVSVNGMIDCSEKRLISEVWNGYTYFRRHDIVIAKITPCFENGKGACLDDLETKIGFGTTEFIVLRPTNLVLPRFLYFLTKTSMFRHLGAKAMTGAAGQKRVPNDFVKNFEAGIPSTDEQQSILKYIDEESKKIDLAISRAKREIDLIREYRTRLIADVVTGKVDVRGIPVEKIEGLEGLEDTDVQEELQEGEEIKETEESLDAND